MCAEDLRVYVRWEVIVVKACSPVRVGLVLGQGLAEKPVRLRECKRKRLIKMAVPSCL